MNTLRYIHLFSILLIPTLSFAHLNDTAQQFKERVAARQLYRHHCASSAKRSVHGRYHISEDKYTLCKACDLFESMGNGDEILSDKLLQEKHRNECIEYYAKEFKSSKDSEQLVSFCSEQAREFARLIERVIRTTVNGERLP